MRMHRALLLATVLAVSPLDGLAEEKPIVDVKELAGNWRGWVAEVAGDEWATMKRLGRRRLQSCDAELDDRGEILSSSRNATVSRVTNHALSDAIGAGPRNRDRLRRQGQDPS